MAKYSILVLFFYAVSLAADPSMVGKGGQQKAEALVDEDFKNGAWRWQPTDPKAWKIEQTDEGPVYHQFSKRSNFNPPHRSPYNIALLKDINVGSFILDAWVKSTVKDYGHRDVCLFFNYQNPAQFYYVHFGKQMDDHANQIFIVNKADRKKISTKTSDGTAWDDNWHHLRVVRNAQNGAIRVYFDDMKTPVMIAKDRTFTSGRIGIGTFDDTSMWKRVTIRELASTNPSTR